MYECMFVKTPPIGFELRVKRHIHKMKLFTVIDDGEKSKIITVKYFSTWQKCQLKDKVKEKQGSIDKEIKHIHNT